MMCASNGYWSSCSENLSDVQAFAEERENYRVKGREFEQTREIKKLQRELSYQLSLPDLFPVKEEIKLLFSSSVPEVGCSSSLISRIFNGFYS